MSFITKDRIMIGIKILFPVTLLLLVTLELSEMFQTIDVGLLKKYINKLDISALLFIIIGGFISLSPMYLYDYYLSNEIRVEIPKKRMTKYSLISNSFSNLLGFGGLIGIVLRTYFYQRYEPDKKKLLRGIAFITMFYLTGISIFTWVVLFNSWSMPLIRNHHWLFLSVLIVGMIFPALLISFFIKKTKLHTIIQSRKRAISLVIASLIEWAFVFLYLYSLAVMMKLPVTIWDFFMIFLVAVSAGIVSMIPGGIGSFDLVFIWGFEYIGIPTEKLIVVLLLYRIGYYFIPFICGLLLLLRDLWKKWNNYWSNIPKAIVEKGSHFFLTLLVFISGIILIISGALPGILSRLQIIEEIVSLPVMNFTHHVSIGAGFALLGLARGIEYREKRTYHLTLFVLCIAVISTFLKGLDYEEASILIGVILLLLMSKGRFYRESFVLTWGKVLFDVFIIGLFTFAYLCMGFFSLPSNKGKLPSFIQPYVILDAKSLFISAIIGLSIAFIILILGYLINKQKGLIMLSSRNQDKNIQQHIEKYGGSTSSHLLFLHDKYIYWNKDKTVLFAYQTYADKLVVLGDPIGEESKFLKAIEELYETADIFGYTPVFYQNSKYMLPFLHANGFDFFKLGEEGHVQVSEFSLSGKKMKNYRAINNKFEREGYLVHVSSSPHNNELLDKLNIVSKSWLQGRNEKGFSLGYFDKDYLNTGEIVYVTDPNNQILAFLTLTPPHSTNNSCSIDLMRNLPDSPPSIMDYLFIHTFHLLKEREVSWCNLGMAPLSNLGLSKFSFLSEKIADQIFKHGHVFYQFKGLRNFKNKYCHHWEPRYLSYRKKSSLPFTSAQVTMLVSRAKKRL